MATDDRKDPYRSFNYLVNIEGTDVAGFSEVAGLSAEGDSVDYREGADAENHVRKLMGLRKYTPLTFKRGYTKNDILWRWYTNIANGKQDRRAVTVTLLNEEHHPVIHWNAEGAWINKVEGPSFNATGNEVAIESMEVIIEKLTIELEA
jgi:phage tail-like protein